jgi:hypothetical protein
VGISLLRDVADVEKADRWDEEPDDSQEDVEVAE